MRKQYSRKDIAVIEIVHAILWAAAIIVASALWGDAPGAPNVAVWGAVGYVLANGLLLAVLMRRLR